MSKPNDGGPAFPHDGQANYTGGATLRDYFAAHETLAEYDVDPLPTYLAEALAGPMPQGGWGSQQTPEHYRAMLAWDAKWRAELKYIRAAAMIAAREKRYA